MTTITITELAAKYAESIRSIADLYLSIYGVDGMDGMALALFNIVLDELGTVYPSETTRDLHDELMAIDDWRDAFESVMWGEVEERNLVTVLGTDEEAETETIKLDAESTLNGNHINAPLRSCKPVDQPTGERVTVELDGTTYERTVYERIIWRASGRHTVSARFVIIDGTNYLV